MYRRLYKALERSRPNAKLTTLIGQLAARRQTQKDKANLRSTHASIAVHSAWTLAPMKMPVRPLADPEDETGVDSFSPLLLLFVLGKENASLLDF